MNRLRLSTFVISTAFWFCSWLRCRGRTARRTSAPPSGESTAAPAKAQPANRSSGPATEGVAKAGRRNSGPSEPDGNATHRCGGHGDNQTSGNTGQQTAGSRETPGRYCRPARRQTSSSSSTTGARPAARSLSRTGSPLRMALTFSWPIRPMSGDYQITPNDKQPYYIDWIVVQK